MQGFQFILFSHVYVFLLPTFRGKLHYVLMSFCVLICLTLKAVKKKDDKIYTCRLKKKMFVQAMRAPDKRGY